jgi:hypothetical protein
MTCQILNRSFPPKFHGFAPFRNSAVESDRRKSNTIVLREL